MTLDEEIWRLARSERQRRIGEQLSAELTDDERAWVDVNVATVQADARR